MKTNPEHESGLTPEAESLTRLGTTIAQERNRLRGDDTTEAVQSESQVIKHFGDQEREREKRGPEMAAGVPLAEVGQLDAAPGRGRLGATQGFRGSGVGVRATEISAGWLAALLLVLAYGGRAAADHSVEGLDLLLSYQ